ncbi:hypothetical protein ACFV1W_31360 [Kitasatospora sp. NPDC059648]|uniref:hypothetical protein n=1 Tax=Kitasatospora sp. NPDC059648 TaxID=3346894 RepID=UPI0036CCA99D
MLGGNDAVGAAGGLASVDQRAVGQRAAHSLADVGGTRFSVRFGKLNHCTVNDDDPTGAKCIENAVVPDGHTPNSTYTRSNPSAISRTSSQVSAIRGYRRAASASVIMIYGAGVLKRGLVSRSQYRVWD